MVEATGSADPHLAQQLGEQMAYYRAIANEYGDHPIDAPGQPELVAAFESFAIDGDVLELACGSGAWTERLAVSAASVTAVDASAEMIARARGVVDEDVVRFVTADIFSWSPPRRYDSVFFGFWLSHVPLQHFEWFWTLVSDCLEPEGRVFFVDDNHRTAEELIEGPRSHTVERRLNNGVAYRAIKVPHDAAGLTVRLRELGWDFSVGSAGPFYWGSGCRLT